MENKRRIEGFALGGTRNTKSDLLRRHDGWRSTARSAAFMLQDEVEGEPQDVKIPPIAQPKTNPTTADAAAACGK